MFAQGNGLLMQLEEQIEGRGRIVPVRRPYVIDTQSVQTSTSLPTQSQGSNAGKTVA
ncbi:hypothetical protein GCM10010350_79310 [Streptomyces galilaeus]|nr:hypothetical protein GCM10010350_79310 [Streptomyces galilaeus]